ncbi:Signal transducer regulating beta-lactamase production, contains metallopeptidase domain [Mucilaginibacter pineti]|uniref:Signal transducer regulating beta-lactamase production, contains metallopeptidase domain n=1 Tax=Mucilaginibacter pineti TaxID=1391627 RepID=A0A1G7I4B2_9SPHI|nr:M56 family metallopeptidase [Mucilaginibacter pineti]SDF07234.1 Signal transducer regulating beta-lactamase production, contains metallopeptidase domain [Mucilaginibacter pineti]
MNAMIYLAQVSACTGIFYMFYYVLLRRLTFFTINRWYLLLTLLLSFIIPVLKIKLDEQPHYVEAVKQAVYVNTIYVIVQGQAINKPLPNAVIPHTVNWINLLRLLYFTITTGLFVHLLIIVTVFFKRLKGKAGTKIGNVHILNAHKTQGNGSFLNYIFLNEDNLTHDELQQIIAHEMLHVKLYHSVDRIIVKIVHIILWFNPFVYLYGRAITANHEFEVDKKVASKTDRQFYASLLLNLAVNKPAGLYNGFSNVPVTRRIHMLFNKPSTNMKKVVYLLAIPVVMISCLAFAGIKSKISSVVKRQQQKQEITYRQKVNAKQKTQRDSMDAYRKTDDFKNKMALLGQIWNKEINVEVKDILKNKTTGKTRGFLIAYDNREYEMSTFYGQEKQLNGQLNIGDNITLKVRGGSFSKDKGIDVTPAYVIKNGVKIFQLVEALPLPKYAFLYEANKVRFTSGQVTHIVKFDNGKWKSAVLETVNGYKFNLRFKQNAPAFADLEWGDHVTLRFVHEVKTGDKDYNVNDWVSISKDEKDYGFKNPDLFNKFYERG